MSKKVLIVDDAVFMRTILRKLLERNGYTVVDEAGDGKKAVNRYKELLGSEEQPDLVILDITMPEMDGLTALKEILKINENACVIMCSSLAGQHIVVEAVKTGAKNFIVKPFDEDKVIEIIQKVLG